MITMDVDMKKVTTSYYDCMSYLIRDNEMTDDERAKLLCMLVCSDREMRALSISMLRAIFMRRYEVVRYEPYDCLRHLFPLVTLLYNCYRDDLKLTGYDDLIMLKISSIKTDTYE